MEEKENRRKNTRSAVWNNVVADVEVDEPYQKKSKSKMKIKGPVRDIGSQGMFVVSGESVPMNANADISIDFDSRRPGTLTLSAQGKTVRRSIDGFGIQFTKINLKRLMECITGRMNRP